jgi:hypothetical protein
MQSGVAMLVIVATLMTPVAALHATQVCVGCPVPKKTRISDGKWQTAVQLGKGVTKTDAELIVRAARRNEITDRPLNDKHEKWRPLDIGAVSYIGDASSYFAEPNPMLGRAESNVRYFSLTQPGLFPRNEWEEHIIAVGAGRTERIAVVGWVA